MKFTRKQLAAFGLGAVGKDMVYMLSSAYVMYYYQDLLHLSATFVGLILMVARVFDALNDPFMGIVVAKTRTRWGRFRPWLFSGTVLNALVLYALFAAPQGLEGTGLMVYFAVIYILWGMTYTMMDIPYWSMIPAVTDTQPDREKLSVVGRTCAGVGSALISVFALPMVAMLGNGSERAGFARVTLIVSLLFVVAEVICCLFIREKPLDRQKSDAADKRGIGDMLKTLFQNDQAVVVALAIVLINSALYITSNLVIYFFKYDMGGAGWHSNYMVFNMVGGACQILGMMLLYPVLHRKLPNERIFVVALLMSMLGYGLLLTFCFAGMAGNLILLCVPGVLIFAANGMLSVLTTVFLANTVDYGEKATGHREESVIFSMQTFVVKAASGLAVFITGIGLDLIGLVGNTEETGEIVAQSASTINGLRLLMTVLPALGLVVALIFFLKKFKLTDKVAKEISEELRGK